MAKEQEVIPVYANIHNSILMRFDPEWVHLDENTTKYMIKCKDGVLEVVVKESYINRGEG